MRRLASPRVLHYLTPTDAALSIDARRGERMRFPSDAPVTPAKRDALRLRLAALGLQLERVDEQAIRASGPGGQSVNKRATGVLLRYPLGDDLLVVKWTRERQHALNRFLALRELADEVEARRSPESNPRQRVIQRIRRQKDRRRRRRVGHPA
jgi:protein subunit release factor B